LPTFVPGFTNPKRAVLAPGKTLNTMANNGLDKKFPSTFSLSLFIWTYSKEIQLKRGDYISTEF